MAANIGSRWRLGLCDASDLAKLLLDVADDFTEVGLTLYQAALSQRFGF